MGKFDHVEIKKTKATERKQKWRQISENQESEAENEKTRLQNLSVSEKTIRLENNRKSQRRRREKIKPQQKKVQHIFCRPRIFRHRWIRSTGKIRLQRLYKDAP